GDSLTLPVRAPQGLREGNLGDRVHRRRVVAGRRGPEGGHLLVRDPAHDMRTRGPDRVEDPALDRFVLTFVAPWMRPVECGHVAVDGNARLKNEPAHESLLVSCVLIDRSRRGNSSLR